MNVLTKFNKNRKKNNVILIRFFFNEYSIEHEGL